ncbi:ImmA/IrrE family metallo-endopeptidase [Hyalangium versicolor]|uniref:ImmA/IrrE family metallo-endopeptidase n=1 Tax=Hyalangium versicolor TaxID=2861190 RepID=UPI001CCE02D5|nr:ImmA/IrrE family metallo-endopeptidase [Hyalangium versicolor]
MRMNPRTLASTQLVQELATLPTLLPMQRERNRAPLPLLQEWYPALLGALETIPFTAPVHHDGIRDIQEWNPLGQRLYVPRRVLPGTPTRPDLSQIKVAILWFVELAHELCHIILWEPFFTGRLNPLGTREHFLDWGYLTEAFCFWFADALLLPDIAVQRVDEPSIANDSVGLKGLFNPASVLTSLGYRAGTRQLEVFLGLLGFDADWKDRHTDDSSFNCLRRRLWSFRTSTEESSSRWRELLVTTGMHDRFFESFCALPDIPSLMDSVPTSLEEHDIRAFLLALARRGVGVGCEQGPATVKRVRLRRELQARAYWLLQLQHALKDARISFDTGRAGAPSGALRAVDKMLLELEQALRRLCTRSRTTGAEAALAQVDQEFDKWMKTLGRRGAFVSRRELFAPDSHLARFHVPSIGLSRNGVRLTRKTTEQITRTLQPPWERMVSRRDRAEADAVLRSARQLGRGKDSAASFDDFLSSRLMRGHWSVELGGLSFQRNTLRELLFEIA